MAEVWRRMLVLLLVVFAIASQGFTQQKDLPEPPDMHTGSPPIPPKWIVFAEPPIPLPPDPQFPDSPFDPSSLPGLPDNSKSRLKRALDRAKPNCLDAIVHTCWSSSPGDNTAGISFEDREFAKDMDIGTYHFRNKNYRGAEFRFRHALECKPGQPDATFKLAETLRKLGKNDEAREEYQAYLGAQPNGPYGEKARSALVRLSKLSAGKN